jgi:hypothetical protein
MHFRGALTLPLIIFISLLSVLNDTQNTTLSNHPIRRTADRQRRSDRQMISMSHTALCDRLQLLCVQTMLRISGIEIPTSAFCFRSGFYALLRSVHGEPTEATDVTTGEDQSE